MSRTYDRFTPIPNSSARVLPDPDAIPAPTPVEVVLPPTPARMLPPPVLVSGLGAAMAVARRSVTGARLASAQGVSAARTISVHSFNAEMNRRLSRISGVEFRSDLYGALFAIFKSKFSGIPTHKIQSFTDVAALRRGVVSQIRGNTPSYLHDIALEISEIATGKCANRFSGEFKARITAFISSSSLAELLNSDDERPRAVRKLLEFLTPEVLESYYQFISAEGTVAGDVELKALVQMFETNLMLFKESLRLTITYNSRWPHLHVHNSRLGVYRLLDSIDSLRELLEPPTPVFIGDDHGSLPFLALTPQLTGRSNPLSPGFFVADAAAFDGASASAASSFRAADDSAYNAAELALIEKLRVAAEKALLKKSIVGVDGAKVQTGEINLARLQTIIPDRFTHNRTRFEKSRVSQEAVLRARILTARTRVLDEKTKLLTQYKEVVEARSSTPITMAQMKEAFLRAIQDEVEADCEDTRGYLLGRGAWLDELNGLARFSVEGEGDAAITLEHVMSKYRAQLMDNFKSLIVSANEWPSDMWLLSESRKLQFAQKELGATALEKDMTQQESDAENAKTDTIAEEVYETEEGYRAAMAERLKIMLLRDATLAPAQAAAPAYTLSPLLRRRVATPVAISAFRPLTPDHPDTLEMGALLAREYPGVREAKINLILFEGLPPDIRDKDDNTLLHLALTNELESYGEELKTIVDYLIRRGASVSVVNRFFQSPPALVTSKTAYSQAAAAGTPADFAKQIFTLCEQAYAFEQQEQVLISHIDRFVVDMTGHIKSYQALTEERRESLWFKWFQTTAMTARRAEELAAIQTLVENLKVSRYQVLELVDRITSRSRQAYLGFLKGSRFHRPVILHTQRLQSSQDFRRADLVYAGTRYDYWDLMSQQNMAGLEKRLVEAQAGNERKLAEGRAETAAVRREAHAEVTAVREEARAETDRKVTEVREEARAETDRKVTEVREEARADVAEARAETVAVREQAHAETERLRGEFSAQVADLYRLFRSRPGGGAGGADSVPSSGPPADIDDAGASSDYRA